MNILNRLGGPFWKPTKGGESNDRMRGASRYYSEPLERHSYWNASAQQWLRDQFGLLENITIHEIPFCRTPTKFDQSLESNGR